LNFPFEYRMEVSRQFLTSAAYDFNDISGQSYKAWPTHTHTHIYTDIHIHSKKLVQYSKQL